MYANVSMARALLRPGERIQAIRDVGYRFTPGKGEENNGEHCDK
jgi:hypothetical protein